MNKVKGFTLIELVIVIGILSIISFIVIPNSRVLTDYKEKNELREFVCDLNYARNNAIVESIPYLVNIDRNKNEYSIYRRQQNPDILKNKKFVNGIKIIRANFGNPNTGVHNFRFYPGGSSSKVGTIDLEDSKGEQIEITIGVATAKVRVYNKGKLDENE